MSDHTARFHRQFEMPYGAEGHRIIWPAGWAGPISRVAAIAAHKAGVADIEPPIAEGPAPAVEIPADWDRLPAAELIELARQLGGGEEIKTKAAAAEYVAQKVADLEATQKSLV